jgi:hypothetical protein
VDGHVDANWAKQHHDLWYQELQAGQDGNEPAEGQAAGGTHAGGVASPVIKD